MFAAGNTRGRRSRLVYCRAASAFCFHVLSRLSRVTFFFFLMPCNTRRRIHCAFLFSFFFFKSRSIICQRTLQFASLVMKCALTKRSSPRLQAPRCLTAYLRHFYCDLTGAKSLVLSHCYDGFFTAQRAVRASHSSRSCASWGEGGGGFISQFSSIGRNFEMSLK